MELDIKTPPHSQSAERMLLSCVLLDEDKYTDISGLIFQNSFYYKEHQTIFYYMGQLFRTYKNIDAITLSAILTKEDKLEYIGGNNYINDLVSLVPNAANIFSYADIIRECYIRRELIKLSTKMADMCYHPKELGAEDILDKVEHEIFQIKDSNAEKQQFNHVNDILDQVLEQIVSTDPNSGTGVKTNFVELDKFTSGLQKGELIILAGRPSMGKTSLAMNIAENIAVSHNNPVAIFSLEMTAVQLTYRLVSSFSKVNHRNIKNNNLNDAETDDVYHAIESLRKSKIYVSQDTNVTSLDIRSYARRLKSQLPSLSLIVIDYVQILNIPRNSKGYSNRAQDLGEVSRSLKALALELDIPILLLSQLNREVENRQDKKPTMADLRESGALEQDADLILLLYRDEYYNRDNDISRGVTEVIVAKNRNGATGIFELKFTPKCVRFDNLYMD